MNQPLISIIIPTYNRQSFITATLNAIVSQSYTHWECIIVDDGSTDNTLKIVNEFVKKDTRFKLFQRPNNLPKGANSCRNFGYEKASGNYIKWFDSDDILHSDALQNQLKYFENNPTVDVVVSKIQIVDSKNNKILKTNNIDSNSLILDYFINKVSFYVCGPLWKTSFLDKKNLFDSSISNLDDWDFNLRMLHANPNIYFDNQIIADYISHDDSLSKEISKLNKTEIESEFNARKKVFDFYKNKLSVTEILEINSFNSERYKQILTQALVQKNPDTKFYFVQYLQFLWENRSYLKAIKTIFVFIAIRVFNKGYKFL